MSRSTAPVDPLEPEITALRRRQRALEAAVGTGESGEAWTTARDAFDQLEAGLAINPPTTASLRVVNTAIATLRSVLRDGAAGAGLWREIRTNAETLRRLIDSTRRRGSPEDRYADREAERQRRKAEALQEAGLRGPPPAPAARRRTRGRASS